MPKFKDYSYLTEHKKFSVLGRSLPSLYFYSRLFGILFQSSRLAQSGEYDDKAWANSSMKVLGYLEDVGVSVNITGLEHLQNIEGPCVIIGNHMSFLETLLLPVMVCPYRRLTFVVKQSLLEYPIFKHILQACDPIAVGRTNPRQDLKTVLTEGEKRLQADISVMVFPQSTRSHRFKPEQMSSIGVKLAKRTDAPIIPLALKTDALRNGKYIKDFGRIDTSIPVHFAFDAPIPVIGKGGQEQDYINGFIKKKLRQWGRELEEI